MKNAIRVFRAEDEPHVIALWEACGLVRAWNPPSRDIAEKMKVQPELFWVAESEGQIVGSIMGAYDGHRGVVNYLAVRPSVRGQGLGAKMMNKMEKALKTLGCPKINVMVRRDNLSIHEFYKDLGYDEQDVIVLGKWLD